MADLEFAVYRIPIEQVGGNSYLVLRGSEVVVVDTGTPGNGKRIVDEASNLGGRIKAIILTHYHIDHAGSAAEIKQSTGAELYVHEADAPYVSGKEKPPLPANVPSEASRAYANYNPVQPDRTLREGDILFGFRILHVPGHTPGSIALYDGRFLFSGDNMNFRESKIQGTPAVYDWNREQAAASVRRLASLSFDVLLPGHGVPVIGSASDKARLDLGLVRGRSVES
ncbi:MAG: MBL fold metallo-hydrolase [Thermoprotei archaeon]|nr:MBL fold metallo-hydrolase [TACK group archaeon]